MPTPIRVAFTSTLIDSGLADVIIGAYNAYSSGVYAITKLGPGGSGASMNTGRQGLADIVFAHERVGEFVFLAERYALSRQWAFFNYFVMVGPAGGPISGTDLLSFINALNTNWKTGPNNVTFVSRGPNGRSGTYVRELQLWKRANLIRPVPVLTPGPGIIDAGGGAISTLETMDYLINNGTPNVYTLIDLGTFYEYLGGHSSSLTILTLGNSSDDFALNQYVAMPVDSGACLPSNTLPINTAGAEDFMTWLLGSSAQSIINNYGTGQNPSKPGIVWNATPQAPEIPTDEQTPGDNCIIKAVPEIQE